MSPPNLTMISLTVLHYSLVSYYVLTALEFESCTWFFACFRNAIAKRIGVAEPPAPRCAPHPLCPNVTSTAEACYSIVSLVLISRFDTHFSVVKLYRVEHSEGIQPSIDMQLRIIQVERGRF